MTPRRMDTDSDVLAPKHWLRSIGSEAASTPSLKYAAKLYHEPFRDENEGRIFESPNFETVDVRGTVVSLRIGDSYS